MGAGGECLPGVAAGRGRQGPGSGAGRRGSLPQVGLWAPVALRAGLWGPPGVTGPRGAESPPLGQGTPPGPGCILRTTEGSHLALLCRAGPPGSSRTSSSLDVWELTCPKLDDRDVTVAVLGSGRGWSPGWCWGLGERAAFHGLAEGTATMSPSTACTPPSPTDMAARRSPSKVHP